MKLIIGNRESGTGNRELSPCSLFGHVIQMFQKCKSGIRNQFPVPFYLYFGWYLFLVLSISSECKALNGTKELTLFVCI